MNILLILPPSFSEVLCSTALIRCLKKQVAHAKIEVLVPAAFAYLLSANRYINRLLFAHQLHTDIAPGKYEVLIDLAALEENRRWAKSSGAKYFSTSDTSVWRIVSRFVGASTKEHLALQFVNAIRSLEVRYDGAGLDFFLPENGKITEQDIPTAHSAGYVVLAFGNAVPMRLQSLEIFCSRINFPVMITGSREVFAAAAQLAAIDPIKVYNACGKFSDAETADLLGRSRVVISADPGWLQVAAAFNRPTIVFRTGQQTPSLIPPLYAQHLLQAAKAPFSQLDLAGNTRYNIEANKNESPHPATAATAERLLVLVTEKLQG